MATYKVQDLFNQLSEIINDGYEFVDVYESEADDDFPTSLSFEAIDEYENIGYDGVESCEIPPDHDFNSISTTVRTDSYCSSIVFTYDEIFTIEHAVNNALEYFKECSKDPSYSKEVLAEIKASSIKCRNLQAKLAKYLKRFKAK